MSISPADVLGLNPSTPKLNEYLTSLASSSSQTNSFPEEKRFPNSVYFNHYNLGLSLQFIPINGYKPKPGNELQKDSLVLDGIDIYNTSGSTEAPTAGGKPPRKIANAQYSPYPSFPIRIPKKPGSDEVFEVLPTSTGKDFVGFLGEPTRKGGGSGPTGGAIGIWCEWKEVGIMVEFGGDEAQGTQAWERGKDARWAVLTFFK